MFFKAAPTPGIEASRAQPEPQVQTLANKDHLLPAWESAAAAWPARAVDVGSQTRVSALGSPSPPSSSLCAAHHSHLTPCILSCPFSSAQLPPTPSCALAECFRKVGAGGRGEAGSPATEDKGNSACERIMAGQREG